MFYVSLDYLVCGVGDSNKRGLTGTINHMLNKVYYEKHHSGIGANVVTHSNFVLSARVKISKKCYS